MPDEETTELPKPPGAILATKSKDRQSEHTANYTHKNSPSLEETLNEME